MTLQEFRNSLRNDQPPRDLGVALVGLWWDAKGDWTRAHESAQQDEGPSGAWAHAYLHRKEGDASNAEYWYRRAHKTPSPASLEQEWTEIAEALLREASASSAYGSNPFNRPHALNIAEAEQRRKV
jgi:hypothetical protein